MNEPITRVSLTHVQVPFKEPFRIANGEVSLKDAILVLIETAGGLVGVGESSPMASSFGYSTDTPEGCWNDLAERIVPRLLGGWIQSPEQIGSMAQAWDGCSRFAVAGAETACWDLLGQMRHLCLAELLGAPGDRIAAGVASGLAVGLYPTIVDLLRGIEQHLSEGYRRLKLKIKPGDDIEIIRAVRAHFGPDVPLSVDANGSYTIEHLDTLRQLDDFDLVMIEQPMAAEDLDGLAALQAAITTPVCIDETAETVERTEAAIDRGACRIVNLKLQRVGGIGPAVAIHDLCLARGVACWVGTMPELGLGQSVGLHLGTLPNCRYASDIEPSTRWFTDDIVSPLIDFAFPGMIEVPDRPGIGVQVDWAKVRRYRVRHEEFTAPAS